MFFHHGKWTEFKTEFMTPKRHLINASCHSLEVNCDTKLFMFELSSWMNGCVHIFHAVGLESLQALSFPLRFFLFCFFVLFFVCSFFCFCCCFVFVLSMKQRTKFKKNLKTEFVLF